MAKQKSNFLGVERKDLTSIFVDTKFTILFLLLIFGSVVLGCKMFSRYANPGGVIFTVEIQTNEPNRNEIIERAMKTVESRLNHIGADGEVERVAGRDSQIAVKIYHPSDIERLKRFLLTTYQLELKKVISRSSPAPIETYHSAEAAKSVATNEQEVLPYVERDENIAGEINPRAFVIVEKAAIINGEDIRDASAVAKIGDPASFSISFTLRPDAAVKFGDWTEKNIGSYIAIVLDKQVISAPYIKSRIDGEGQIDGRFTREPAEDIALSLKSGYLPAQMKIIKEETFAK